MSLFQDTTDPDELTRKTDYVVSSGLLSEFILNVVSSGEKKTFAKNGYFGSMSPVYVGDTPTPSGVIIYAPVEIVTRKATELTIILIIRGIVFFNNWINPSLIGGTAHFPPD